jgi:hypothetical protein
MNLLSIDTDRLADTGAPELVLHVEFEANDGSRWHAVGGGRSRDEAIAYARESTPAGRYWRVVRMRDLYGD